MITKEEILEKLKEILDPELRVPIVDLGLIYDVHLSGEGDVKIVMTLTTIGCPLSAYFEDAIVSKVKEIGSVRNVEIELTFDPPWDPSMIKSDELKLALGLL